MVNGKAREGKSVFRKKPLLSLYEKKKKNEQYVLHIQREYLCHISKTFKCALLPQKPLKNRSVLITAK